MNKKNSECAILCRGGIFRNDLDRVESPSIHLMISFQKQCIFSCFRYGPGHSRHITQRRRVLKWRGPERTIPAEKAFCTPWPLSKHKYLRGTRGKKLMQPIFSFRASTRRRTMMFWFFPSLKFPFQNWKGARASASFHVNLEANLKSYSAYNWELPHVPFPSYNLDISTENILSLERTFEK